MKSLMLLWSQYWVPSNRGYGEKSLLGIRHERN
ncbi:hypothetical protein C8J26_2619 [Sphingomonas aurantiaca]|uniref:Uncharacterized protein n=1 Tax=Sphingomonas aurantiaca TaxID=185949 RepID=A0A2T5GKC0_9SPHN|nr:hypothetical protein C8J26_2619 [Sphingomonas aurantiaca]